MQLCLVELKYGNPNEIKFEYGMVVDCSWIYLDGLVFGCSNAHDLLRFVLDADDVQD